MKYYISLYGKVKIGLPSIINYVKHLRHSHVTHSVRAHVGFCRLLYYNTRMKFIVLKFILEIGPFWYLNDKTNSGGKKLRNLQCVRFSKTNGA